MFLLLRGRWFPRAGDFANPLAPTEKLQPRSMISAARWQQNGGTLLHIIVCPVAVDEEIPEHHNDDGNRQGEIFGEKIGREDGDLEGQALEKTKQQRLSKLQDRYADGEAQHTDNNKLNKLSRWRL